MNFWQYGRLYNVREIFHKRHKQKGRSKQYHDPLIQNEHQINKRKIIYAKKHKAIELLQQHANTRQINRTPYERRRINFNRMRWKLYKVWKTCAACKQQPTNHIHHIIMLKNGGTNHRNNLIGLCKDCHNEIHPWMMKDVDSITKEYREIVRQF